MPLSLARAARRDAWWRTGGTSAGVDRALPVRHQPEDGPGVALR